MVLKRGNYPTGYRSRRDSDYSMAILHFAKILCRQPFPELSSSSSAIPQIRNIERQPSPDNIWNGMYQREFSYSVKLEAFSGKQTWSTAKFFFSS